MSDRASELVVSAIGMVSPLGFDARSTCAAVRADLSAFSRYRLYAPQLATPRSGGRPRLVGATVSWPRRPTEPMEDLWLGAVEDLVAWGKLSEGELASLPVFAALPERASEDFVERMYAKTGLSQHPPGRVEKHGHASGLAVLSHAVRALSSGKCDAALLISVDSCFVFPILKAMDRADKLRCDRCPDAPTPGECGVALLLETRALAKARGRKAMAKITAPHFGTETVLLASEDPSSAQGLCEAIGGALAHMNEPPHWAACDLNGESYRFREWADTRVRLFDQLSSLEHLWHPADCLGDVRAASGPLLMALIARAFDRGYAPADQVLLWTGSEDGLRAAAVMSRA